MRSQSRLNVLKFGGSVLRTEDELPSCVHEVYQHRRQGEQVVVVVSALFGVTDALLERSHRLSSTPSTSALAALLATGEARAQALMVLALEEAGIPAVPLSPQQVGLRADGPDLDGRLLSVDRPQVESHLKAGTVVVLPGFVGRNEEGRSVLLGRGGSDFTALFLADALEADRCCLFKDTGSLYNSDPNTNADARRLISVRFDSARKIGGDVLQEKALAFASEVGRPFEVTGVGSSVPTLVGAETDIVEAGSPAAMGPINVQLLGCGTVGGAVLDRLFLLPSRFNVTGILVRDLDRHVLRGVPPELLTVDPNELLKRPADVVIEALGGLQPAGDLVETALGRGASVITANKFLMANGGQELKRFAAKRGRSLLYSAAVGGSTPALEVTGRVADHMEILSLRGVLNGTCNFILDRLHEGAQLKTAIVGAQEAGFAEANPTMDVTGRDAAQKLVLLIQQAWGVHVTEDDLQVSGIDMLTPEEIAEATSLGLRYRLIAEASRVDGNIRATVSPAALSLSDPLALATGVNNQLQIETSDEVVVTVRGAGAGASPTAESIIGDLIELEAHAACSSVDRRGIEA